MPRASRAHRVRLSTVREVIEALGGSDAVCATFGLTRGAICNWIAEDSFPARYHAALLMICEREGIHWRPPGWDPAVQLRYNPTAERAA